MGVRAYVCDFDGTICPDDIGAAFVERFSRGDGSEARIALERWRAGEIGHRELTVAESRRVEARLEEALAFTRGFRLDPDFPRFARERELGGERVLVASEGFDFYVGDLLEREGLGHLAWSANAARFVEGKLIPEFRPASEGCGRCGNCKGWHVRRHQALGFEVVLVGDGFSDRCGARAADRVLARGDLLAWCRSEGIAAEPFESFADVSAWAVARDADAAQVE